MQKIFESLAFKINPQIFIIIGGILTLFGAYLGNLKSEKSSSVTDLAIKEGHELAQKNIDLTRENTQLSIANKELIQQNLEFARLQQKLTNQNINLTGQVNEKANNINGYISGGDSYCTLTIGDINEEKTVGRMIFQLGEGNKFPLQDVHLRIVDLNSFNSQKLTMDELYKNSFSIGIIEPGKAIVTQKLINLNKEKGVNLNVFFSANNGFFTQIIRMRFVDENWTSATTVTKDGKGIFTKVDSSYPLKNRKLIFK